MDDLLIKQIGVILQKVNDYRKSVGLSELQPFSIDDDKLNLVYLNCFITRLLTIIRIPVMSESRDENVARMNTTRELITELNDWIQKAKIALDILPELSANRAFDLYNKYHCEHFLHLIKPSEMNELYERRFNLVRGEGETICRYWHKDYLNYSPHVFLYESKIPVIEKLPKNSGLSKRVIDAFSMIDIDHNKDLPRYNVTKDLDGSMHPAFISAYNMRINSLIRGKVKLCSSVESKMRIQVNESLLSTLKYINFIDCESYDDFLDSLMNSCKKMFIDASVSKGLDKKSEEYREEYITASSVINEMIKRIRVSVDREYNIVIKQEPRIQFPISLENQIIVKSTLNRVIDVGIKNANLTKLHQILTRNICK